MVNRHASSTPSMFNPDKGIGFILCVMNGGAPIAYSSGHVDRSFQAGVFVFLVLGRPICVCVCFVVVVICV